jgi:hypothetical protein
VLASRADPTSVVSTGGHDTADQNDVNHSVTFTQVISASYMPGTGLEPCAHPDGAQ